MATVILLHALILCVLLSLLSVCAYKLRETRNKIENLSILLTAPEITTRLRKQYNKDSGFLLAVFVLGAIMVALTVISLLTL